MKKTGIVLLNMGGASNLDEVPLFLKNMFNDPQILRIPFKPIRKLVASLIVWRRAGASMGNYRLIGGRSPLLSHTLSLAKKLEAGGGMPVFVAMRYTPPFADEAVAAIKKSGIAKLVLIPLYPQYSTTTTLSSLWDFEEAMVQGGLELPVKKIERFYDHPTYNAAVTERIGEALAGQAAEEYALLFSAHGLPQSVVDGGDPYQKECEAHVELLKKRLTLENRFFSRVDLAYQSKVGPMKWLTPSLEDKLQELRSQGCKKVLIVPLAFTIDNLETDFELSIEYREKAQELGFESYLVARCPNDSDRFAQALLELSEATALKD